MDLAGKSKGRVGLGAQYLNEDFRAISGRSIPQIAVVSEDGSCAGEVFAGNGRDFLATRERAGARFEREAGRMTVSVVIVTWNAKRYGAECLQSLRENCQVPAEIIVVDNASTDATPELVRTDYPECRLVETGANLGFAKGNNIGIALAAGKYLFLVNSDVKILPGC